MSNAPACKQVTASANTLKHMKTGDVFDIQPNDIQPIDIQTSADTTLHFTVLGADIVHHGHGQAVLANAASAIDAPITLTLTTNYPFGRRNVDTPLRYVVYAVLVR